MNIFIEPHREERRKRLKRNKIADVLWYSSVSDYSVLRFIINFPIGFLISLVVYELAWKRLNFLQNDPFYAFIFQWSSVLIITLAFCLSPIIRCSFICVCLASLGRSGQGFFTIFVVEQVIDGPIFNIGHNFQITASIVTCNLELQARIAANRVTLAIGPIEALMEKHFGRITTIGQKMIKTLKILLEPFEEELNPDNTEDETLGAVLDTVQAMSDREALVEGENPLVNENSSISPEKVRPAWTRLKTRLGRASAKRFTQRCQNIFTVGVNNCHKRFQTAQKFCYDNTPFFLTYFTCGRLNVLQMCQATKMQKLSEKYCTLGEKLEKDNPMNPDLDNQMETLQNISEQITSQLKLNLHFQAIEEPENERHSIIDEIKMQISTDIGFLKEIFEIVKDIFTGLLICLILIFFNQAISTIVSFLNDMEYQNNFILPEFWYMDEKRRIDKKTFLGTLNKQEIEDNELLYPWSRPSLFELIRSWVPFTRWCYLCLFSLIFVLLDHVLYKIISYAIKYGETHGYQKGHHILEINVEGEGPIAAIIKEIVNFNYSSSLSETLTNEMCFKQAKPPDWGRAFFFVILPLTIMLFLQIIFNHFVNRATLFYVVGFIFRKRKKARTIYLYNKILMERQKIFNRINKRRNGSE